MQINWAPEHCDALRECLAKGMSFAEAADAINASSAPLIPAMPRSAARNGWGSRPSTGRSGRRGCRKKLENRRPRRNRERAAEPKPDAPVSERPRRVELRCVQIMPRHLALIELEAGDCRYPYGGDAEGEAITFCGHPQREGSSYCLGHFNLTRGPGTASERAAIPVALRLVAAA